nr:hypothetical protein GCM10020185_73640 [Pseudomonas brassicacearum subsp. brassicacearum]
MQIGLPSRLMAPSLGVSRKIDTAQERTLSRAAGADQADDIARFGLQGNALEYFMGTVTFV